MSSPSYSINDLLKKPETQLNKLIAQAQAIEELNTRFAEILDPELSTHCRVGCYIQGVLTLFTDSAGWATRLRYQVPELLSTLRKLPPWAGLGSIQIKIQKNWHQMFAPLSPVLSLEGSATPSEKNREQIQALLNTLKEQVGSEKLAKSLEKLLGLGEG